ncbi:RNA repair transcriptional activator RtcR [Sulfidibacter corallicola]|uniref:RNA repair transcriptional activator RtcR n=1 Tax=Sulfidibacter corallicola TaxID=2818388 RepID=A0A8A4TYR3_SULCO|nr:RNA repair transcriptional activator RtcR [Sulfidibacter corallicola]
MKKVVIGLYGTTLDGGLGKKRWQRWRPTLSICQHEDFLIDRFDLLVPDEFTKAADILIEDMKTVAPETEIQVKPMNFTDPWDFEEVFSTLLRFAQEYPFNEDREEYLLHITTGTHVAQICLFLLTEARYFPANLIQTSPPRGKKAKGAGSYKIIDLDLSKYDLIASRFAKEQEEGTAFLKSGIDTANARFNAMIDQIEKVAIRSKSPILLMGATGAGKSHLAKRIFELKKLRRQVTGRFVEVNCATLRGDAAMSTLFGHVRGAFTGAIGDRPGLLRAAHQGVLFLDEVGELGSDEQAMLLRALEEKSFMPVGSDREVHSDFQLIAGTNRDLWEKVHEGKFREDLLARMNLWTYKLPSLRERPEDIEPNLLYELEKFARTHGRTTTFNKEAYTRFLNFATGPDGQWNANFRDLNASVTRMATLSGGSRINEPIVAEEVERLRAQWERPRLENKVLARYFTKDELEEIDQFDQAQLAKVLEVCEQSRSLAEAGRVLFAASRARKTSSNDSDRLRKYLMKFNLQASDIVGRKYFRPQ